MITKTTRIKHRCEVDLVRVLVMLKLKKLNTRQGINDYYPYSMYKAYAYFPEQK